MRTKFIQGVVIAAVFLISGAALVRAWVSRPGTPPQANISAPLTVSAATERKIGAPNTLEGLLGVNDLYIRSIGKWASELINFRGTREAEFRIMSNRKPLATSPLENCTIRTLSEYNCWLTVERDCPNGYYVVGCSGGMALDMRPNEASQYREPANGLFPARYIGSVPYNSGVPGAPDIGCRAKLQVTAGVDPGPPMRRVPPAAGTNDAAVVYSYCARLQ